MRRSIIVSAEQVAPRYETAANLAVARAIHEHNKAGRETYSMRDGQIVARQPSTGRTVVIGNTYPRRDSR